MRASPRHQRFRAGRHQRADTLSRQTARASHKAVFVAFNQSPYAIVARKNRGIHALSDIGARSRRRRRRSFDPAVASAGTAERDQDRKREAKQHQCRRPRADAVGAGQACRDGVFLLSAVN